MIEQARNFLFSRVDDPAINNPNLDQKIKNKVQNSKNVVNKIKRVGDLYNYLKRFEIKPKPGENEVYDTMQSLGLETYEDIFSEFENEFSHSLDDITTLRDFIIGEVYTSWDIAIFAKSYNVQSGIYRIPGNNGLQAIFIKATLDGGKYPNKWIVPGEELKYYLYSLKEKFDPNYKVNQAIINSTKNNIPIFVFIKNGLELTLTGIFKYIDIIHEDDGSKWFKLKKLPSYETNIPITEQEYNNEIRRKIRNANELTSAERKKEMEKYNKYPESVTVISTGYKRNPYVVAEVLDRANGVCEDCGSPAPFIRASDGTPYLEVHHIVPLSEGGEDTINNALGLCPNCHRKAHYG